MPRINDDSQFENVIRILKSLPRVDTHPAFEMDLRRRLNAEAYKEQKHWSAKLLNPSRLIPSAALAAAAIMILFFTNIEAPKIDDPLSMEPQVREDVLSGSSADQYILDRVVRMNQGLQSASNINYIMKSGLNFRQVNLSAEEKIKLQHLKEKFKNWINSAGNNSQMLK